MTSVRQQVSVGFSLLKIGIKDLLAYKWEFFGDFIRLPITISLHLLIFLVLYQNTTVIQGYTFAEGISYILMVSLVENTISFSLPGNVKRSILSGDLTTDLVRPISPTYVSLVRTLPFQIFQTVNGVIAYLVAAFLFPDVIILPSTGAALAALLLVGIGTLISLLLQFLIGLLTFWIYNIFFLTRILSALTAFLGGRYMPITWLMIPYLHLLPFALIYYYPAALMLGKVSLVSLALPVILGLIFAGLTLLVIEIGMTKGLERYDGAGV